MFYRIPAIFSISIFLVIATACTPTKESPLITAPTKITQWETRLPKQINRIKITYSLPQIAAADFQFFNGPPKRKNAAIARINLSNENCTIGHVASINYKQNSSDFYSQYFEKEIPWNKPNTLIIDFSEKNTLSVTINNETHKTELNYPVTVLNIESRLAPVEIHNIEYFRQ